MIVSVTVSDVMQRPVETVTPESTLVAAARRIDERRVSSVVVVEDDRPVGILTQSDVVHQFVSGGGEETPVRELMSSPLTTIDATETIDVAAELLREEGLTKLPVVDDEGQLVGIVTTVDLSYYIPTLAHQQRGPPERSERRRRTRPDTAYENDDWEFESFGPNDDRIDVGDVVTFSKTLDEDDVEAFAEASGDTNRLHLDEAYARETRFGTRIAHGTLVSGTISAALARLPGLIIYLSQETAYKGPVEIGERVTATCEVIESLGNDRFRLGTEVENADGEVIVEGDAVVVADEIPDV